MNKVIKFLDSTFLDLGRQFKWTYLPPLMVYMAAGISGLTGIVGTFFVKDYLNLSAAFLAGLGFWAGIPWALKMPLGHLVDLIWERKNYMVYFGASLIALSLLIMYGLIIHTEEMSQVFSVETWFVISVILAPVGYVVQDVVADAMTVEAVPLVDENGSDGVTRVELFLDNGNGTFSETGQGDGKLFIPPISTLVAYNVEDSIKLGDEVAYEIWSISTQTFSFWQEVSNQAIQGGGIGALFATPTSNIRTNIISPSNAELEDNAVGWFSTSVVSRVSQVLYEKEGEQLSFDPN